MRTVIFDMDGVLIDSEPLWREAEIDVFASVGVSLTEKMCRETTGMRIDEVIRHWHARYPWSGASHEQVAEQLLNACQHLIIEQGALMAGARDAIETLHARNATLAIASSSPMRLIRAVVDAFAIGDYFTVLHSAEHEPAGKPDPAVYRTTMSLLGAEPHDCVAIEDSPLGVRSARTAGAMVIAVPAPEDASNPEFEMADVVLTSLKDFSPDLIQ